MGLASAMLAGSWVTISESMNPGNFGWNSLISWGYLLSAQIPFCVSIYILDRRHSLTLVSTLLCSVLAFGIAVAFFMLLPFSEEPLSEAAIPYALIIGGIAAIWSLLIHGVSLLMTADH